MNNINFSIVICCYNEEKNIKDLFLSLKNIKYSKNDYEIIIINDGSKDDTIKLIKGYSKLFSSDVNFKVYTINHSGLSVARNTGFNLSKNNFCLFCDADAVIDPYILNAYKKKIIEQIDYIYTGRIENLNKLDSISNLIYNLHNEPSLSLAKNKLIGANMLINKKLVNIEFPFFDDFTARGDETAMFMNLFQKYKITGTNYVKEAIVKNETSSTLRDWFKKMFIEGFNNKILESFFTKKYLKYLIYSFIKINSFFFVILIFLLLFNINHMIIFISLFLFILRLFPRREYLKKGIQNTFKINLLSSILSFFISVIGIIISDIGYSIAFFKNKKMENKQSKAKIINEIII